MTGKVDEGLTGDAPWISPAGARLIAAAFNGDLAEAEEAIVAGADVDTVDPATGLAALHIAVGRDDLPLCRMLAGKWNASFFADRFGRWPTVVAAECRVSDELADYIVEREAAFLASERPRYIS